MFSEKWQLGSCECNRLAKVFRSVSIGGELLHCGSCPRRRSGHQVKALRLVSVVDMTFRRYNQSDEKSSLTIPILPKPYPVENDFDCNRKGDHQLANHLSNRSGPCHGCIWVWIIAGVWQVIRLYRICPTFRFL